MLSYRDLKGPQRVILDRVMEQCDVAAEQREHCGNTIIQIICMEISGKPITIQYKSILGILKITSVLLKYLEEMKDEAVNGGVAGAGRLFNSTN